MTERRMKRTRHRQTIEQNVYDAAIERTHHIFDNHDTVAVAFSGGKDSTATLNVVLEVANQRGHDKPIRVIFYDEEAIPFETEQYVRRVGQRDDVQLEWYCIPFIGNNHCSRSAPIWYPWAEEDEDKWVRPLPPEAIRWWDIPGFSRTLHTYEVNGLLFDPKRDGMTALCLGIRAQESMTRLRAVTRKVTDNYIIEYNEITSKGNLFKCQPADTQITVVTQPSLGSLATEHHTKSLDEINVGDTVLTYRQPRSNFCITGRRVYGVYRKQYVGELIRVTTDTKVSRYTPDHICIAHLGSWKTGHHVYLMRRGNSYRIGRTVAWTGATAGVVARAKTEQADAVWVLAQTNTAQEAAFEESYLSWKYGIPQATFQAGNARTSIKTQEHLDQFWCRIGDLTYAAKTVLTDFGRDIQYPLWQHGDWFSSRRAHQIRACNLMDGMSVVTNDIVEFGKPCARSLITIDREQYEGTVISLGVEEDETYVADGIVTHNCYPVYDWVTEDVWTAPQKFSWDYNRAYDAMELAGLSITHQRCSPPYANEPLQKLWTYKVCFPDVWDKMCARVPGAATAARYAKTELYGFSKRPKKPDGVPWETWIVELINQWPPEERPVVAQRVKNEFGKHFGKTSDPIAATAPHPISGITWDFVVMLAMRGDKLNRKTPTVKVGGLSPEQLEVLRVKYDAQIADMKERGEL